MDTLTDDPVPDKPSGDPVQAKPVGDTVPDEPAGDLDQDKPAKDQVQAKTAGVPVPDKPKRPYGWIAFVILLLLILVTLVLGHRPFIAWWIKREALARGFDLQFEDFNFVPDRVVLQRLQVKMVDVPGVDARCEELIVDLHEFNPQKIQCTGAAVDVDGAPDELQQSLFAFSKAHEDSVRLPLTLEGTFRYGPRDNPLVTMVGLVDSPGTGDLKFDGTFQLLQAKLGTLALRRSKDNKVDLGLGLTLSEKPIVNVVLDASAVPFKGSVTFVSQKVEEVCRAFALPVPNGFAGSSVEGTVSFVIDGALPSTPHHGNASFVVTGWVPPHPRELDGIVFGKTTKTATTFEVAPDLGEVRFTKATVDAGALHLEGKGNAVRDGLSARTKFDLKGAIACSELGASAIGSRVQGIIGDILRGVTRLAVGGTVNIRVMIDADTKSLSAAKVDQAVDIGCRLR